MKLAATRALTKNGNSYTVSIPREFCMVLALQRGSLLDVVLDEERRVLTVTKRERREPDLIEVHPARTNVRPHF